MYATQFRTAFRLIKNIFIFINSIKIYEINVLKIINILKNLKNCDIIHYTSLYIHYNNAIKL